MPIATILPPPPPAPQARSSITMTASQQADEDKKQRQQQQQLHDLSGDRSEQQQMQFSVIIPSVAAILDQITERNDRLRDKADSAQNGSTIFDLHCNAPITVRGYLERIAKYSKCSPECFILALCYLDMLLKKDENFYCTSNNIHRLLLSSILTATKYLDDFYYSNSYYAMLGGVTTKNLNSLEYEFLCRLNFDLYIAPEVFAAYKESLLEWWWSQQQQQQQQQEEEELSKEKQLQLQQQQQQQDETDEEGKGLVTTTITITGLMKSCDDDEEAEGKQQQQHQHHAAADHYDYNHYHHHHYRERSEE